MNTDDLIPLLSADDSASRRGWHCPSETELAGFCDGQLDSAACDSIRPHLLRCEACAASVAFLLRMQEQEVPQAPPALVARARQLATPARRPQWRWSHASALATVLVAVPLAWFVIMSGREVVETPAAIVAPAAQVVSPAEPQAPVVEPVPPPAQKAERAATPAVRGQESFLREPRILAPMDGSVISSEEWEIQWSAADQALQYELTLASSEGDLVWQQNVEGLSVSVPPGVDMQPGAAYYLWVRAYLPDGRTLQSAAVEVRASDLP